MPDCFRETLDPHDYAFRTLCKCRLNMKNTCLKDCCSVRTTKRTPARTRKPGKTKDKSKQLRVVLESAWNKQNGSALRRFGVLYELSETWCYMLIVIARTPMQTIGWLQDHSGCCEMVPPDHATGPWHEPRDEKHYHRNDSSVYVYKCCATHLLTSITQTHA